MRKLKIIQVDIPQYRSLVTAGTLDFPGSVFYHPDFLEISAAVTGLLFQPVLCFDKDELVGLANILSGGKYGFKTVMIPPFFQYFGPVSFSEKQDVFKHLLDFISSFADTSVLSLTPEQSSRFSSSGWKIKNRLTYYLKPDTFDKMKSRCLRNAKKKVNMAARNGVRAATTDKFPEELYLASFARKGLKTPFDIHKLRNWVYSLQAAGLTETFVAVADDHPVAFRTELIWGGYAYDWLAGAATDYLQLGVNQYLMLAIGENLHNRGISHWDLLGGDIKSIAVFKKSFGAAAAGHYEIEKSFTLKGRIYRRLMKFKAGLDG